MANDHEKTAYLTLLSVISMIAVVILHANGCFWAFSTERYWITANVIECVFYFAVPVFFMISGATLLDYRDRYDTKTYAKKRVMKTLVPFLFWTLFGVLFQIYVLKGLSWSDLSFTGLIDAVLNTRYTTIYWFFRVLFALYVVIPLLSLIPKEKKVKVFSWGALILFCASSLIPFCLTVFHTGIEWPMDPGSPTNYLIYLFLGYVLSRTELSPAVRRTSYVLAAMGLVVHILGTYYASMDAGKIVQDYKGYVNLPCLLYAVGVFLFFKQHGNRIMGSFVGKPVRAMASYSFTVYLLHWYLLCLIQKVAVHFGVIVDTALWYRLGAVVVIVPLCMAIGWIVRKIPVLRAVLPA